MYNPYVDGLAKWASEDQAVNDGAAARIVERGYGSSIPLPAS